jgi:hypothetical protein
LSPRFDKVSVAPDFVSIEIISLFGSPSTVLKFSPESVAQRCTLSNLFSKSLLKLRRQKGGQFHGERIPAPIEFRLSLKVYVDKMSGVYRLSGLPDHKKSSKDEKETKE